MICASFPAINVLIMREYNFRQNSSRSMRDFFASSKLKFLKGSKLQTHNLTVTMRGDMGTESPLENSSSGQVLQHDGQDSKGAIFPIERLRRIGPPPPINPETSRRESWYTIVTSPTFSGPTTPEWARKASDEVVGDIESKGRQDS
jgi:hypothetical protein